MNDMDVDEAMGIASYIAKVCPPTGDGSIHDRKLQVPVVLAAEVQRLRARAAAVTAVVPTIREALANATQYCRYHGTDYERAGMQWGRPRCDSCLQPWRVTQALHALDALAQADGQGAAEIETKDND